jgi:hypothetical protein
VDRGSSVGMCQEGTGTRSCYTIMNEEGMNSDRPANEVCHTCAYPDLMCTCTSLSPVSDRDLDL